MKRLSFVNSGLTAALNRIFALYLKSEPYFRAGDRIIVDWDSPSTKPALSSMVAEPYAGLKDVLQTLAPPIMDKTHYVGGAASTTSVCFEYYFTNQRVIDKISEQIRAVDGGTIPSSSGEQGPDLERELGGGRAYARATDSIDKSIAMLLETSGMLHLAAHVARVSSIVKDPQGVTPLKSIVKSLNSPELSRIFGSNQSALYNPITVGAALPYSGSEDDPRHHGWILRVDKASKYAAVCDLNDADLTPSRVIIDLSIACAAAASRDDKASYASAEQGNSALYRSLAVLAGLANLDKVESIVGNVFGEPERIAVQKSAANLLANAEKARALYAAKCFATLEPIVAVAQMVLKHYINDHVIEAMRVTDPATSVVHDVKSYLAFIYSLPVSSSSAKILSKVDVIDSIIVDRQAYAAVTYPPSLATGEYSPGAADRPQALDWALDELRVIIDWLHLLKDKPVWEIYKVGSGMFSTGVVSPARFVPDTATPNIIFTQAGVASGIFPRSPIAQQWTMVYDYGVNRFNGATISQYVLSDPSLRSTATERKTKKGKNDLIHTDFDVRSEPFVLAQFDYDEYKRVVQENADFAEKAKGRISGLALFAKHAPTMWAKRYAPKTSLPPRSYDPRIASWGPASMLPFPVQQGMFGSVVNDYDVKVVNKDLFGKYELVGDKMQLQIWTSSYGGSSKQIPVADSQLPSAIGVKKDNLANPRGLLKRFVSDGPDNAVPSLRDVFFLSNQFFVDALGSDLELYQLAYRPDVHIAVIDYGFSASADERVSAVASTVPVRIARYVNVMDFTRIASGIQSLVGGRTFIDEITHDMVSEDLESMEANLQRSFTEVIPAYRNILIGGNGNS